MFGFHSHSISGFANRIVALHSFSPFDSEGPNQGRKDTNQVKENN